jgi:carboxyl-terminal processing protease
MNHMQTVGLLILVFAVSLGVTDRSRADGVSPSTTVRPQQTAAHLEVFEEVWRTVHEHFYDPTFHGQDWAAVGRRYRPLAAAAMSDDERSAVINRMLSELGASHTGYYTASDPAYYQLLDIFSASLRQPLRRVFPDGQVSYPGIGVFTKSLPTRRS